MKKSVVVSIIFVFIVSFSSWAEIPRYSFDRYHTTAEMNKALKEISAANPSITKLHALARTPGKRWVYILEIGSETRVVKKMKPAVLVVANMEGVIPIASEGAFFLIQQILQKAEVRRDRTWYVLVCGNPDAAQKFFGKPLHKDSCNHRPYNDDMDDQTDEDGVEDLNGDGLITQMRVKDPLGEWVPVPGEPRLLKKADNSKGEKGVYKLFSEGIDNDNDGKYNEDGPGGVNVGVNFPHLFKFFSKKGGAWAGSEDEAYNLFKFVYAHPEIAMTFVLGDTNFCLTPPKGGRKGKADFSKIKIPKRYEKFLNIDIERTYTMKEVMEMVGRFVPAGMEVTEAMVASFLGLGAVVNPLPVDLKFYKELSEKYKKYLKENKLDGQRLEPAKAKDGSFELWSYYHLGIPSFSLDFWTLPQIKKEKKKEGALTAEQIEKMTNEEFIALGEEKINAFLKASNAPAQFKASQVIQALKGGMMTTKRMAAIMKQMPKAPSKEGGDPKQKALLAFSDKVLEGKGYVNWKAFKHPTLGEVEIGGEVPFASNTPPANMIQTLLKGQVPWIFKVVENAAAISIQKTKVVALGNGLYRLKVWLENKGYLPYPTAMGKRNNRIAPVVVSLDGKNIKIIEGKKRAIIKGIDGHKTTVAKWLIYTGKPLILKIILETQMAGKDSRTITLGGKS